MGFDLSELPDLGLPILFSLKWVKDLIIKEDCFILIIIHTTVEHLMFFILAKLLFMFDKTLNDACSKTLSIFAFRQKEGTSNKVHWIDHHCWWWNLPMILISCHHQWWNLPMIWSSRRWEMGAYDWFEDFISIQGIKMEVLMLRMKSRTDVRTISDALSIISQDLKSHGMTNMFGKPTQWPHFSWESEGKSESSTL